MSLWTLAGCVLIGIVAGAVPPLWEGRRMRRDHYHDCRFTTARVASAEPGQILACSFCGEPARVDADGWVVAMTWSEQRRWRQEQQGQR